MFQADGSEFFNAETFGPYLPGIDVSGMDARGVWWCPSSPIADQRRLIPLAVRANAFFHPSYSYFARVETWEPNYAVRPQDLTEKEPNPNRLLMCDSWYFWGGSQAWFYNHGRTRPALHYPETPAWQKHGAPEMAGQQQLYGDGRVVWRSTKGLDLESLPTPIRGVSKMYGTPADGAHYVIPEGAPE